MLFCNTGNIIDLDTEHADITSVLLPFSQSKLQWKAIASFDHFLKVDTCNPNNYTLLVGTTSFCPVVQRRPTDDVGPTVTLVNGCEEIGPTFTFATGAIAKLGQSEMLPYQRWANGAQRLTHRWLFGWRPMPHVHVIYMYGKRYYWAKRLSWTGIIKKV